MRIAARWASLLVLANLPQMQPPIVHELSDRYAADQGIAVSASDIDHDVRTQQLVRELGGPGR